MLPGSQGLLNAVSSSSGITLVDYAFQAFSGTTISVNYPAGTVSGDFVVLFVSEYWGGGSVSTPSGWTFINSNTLVAHYQFQAFYKVVGGETTVSVSGGGTTQILIMSFRGVNSSTPLDNTSTTTGVNDTNTSFSFTNRPTATANAYEITCIQFGKSTTVTMNTNAKLTSRLSDNATTALGNTGTIAFESGYIQAPTDAGSISGSISPVRAKYMISFALRPA